MSLVEALTSKKLTTLYKNLRGRIAKGINVMAMIAGPANFFNNIRTLNQTYRGMTFTPAAALQVMGSQISRASNTSC
jgi:hypothetical protein